MSDGVWARSVEEISWVLKYTGQIEDKGLPPQVTWQTKA